MATRADRKPIEKKSLWQRFLELLIPPWIQVAAALVCAGIVYLADLWVRPDQARLRAEKQSSQLVRNQLLDLEKRLPQEREQDLQARVRAVQGQTLDRDGDLEALLQSMGEIVKKEGWKGKITPLALIQLTSEVPSLFAYPVVVDVSVPADFSRGSRESDQVRLLRLLRKLDALPAKHQLVGVEILSNVQGGFSAKCTYHYYKVRRG
jgi:membrane-associated protease RseP (regulator of RpoE activity)